MRRVARAARPAPRSSSASSTIEHALTQAARSSLPEPRRLELLEQVRTELSPYRAQMPADAFRDAEEALLGELARRHFSLPQVRLDG